MLNRIVAKIISHLCGQYIEKIDSSQLELEIWNGRAHMENVRIMENSFLAHQVPFRVKYGLIGSISLTFPWSKLSTEPCIVDIENILLAGEVYGGALITQDFTVQKNQNETEITEQTMWDKMLTNIIDNLIINLRNVHIRIEASVESQKFIAIGMVISSIKAFTVDKEGQQTILKEHQNSLLKKVTIKNFGIYADTDAIEINNTDIEIFKNKMIYEITNDQHQFILKPFSFDGILNNDQTVILNTKSSFSMNSDNIELILDHHQFKGMQVLMNQYKLFCKQRLYSHCGRPDRPPRSERSSTLWWCYAHRCSLDKNNRNLIDTKGVLEMLKNRKEYYEIWSNYIKNSSTYKSQIESFEDQLDSNTITLLRSYSTFIYQNKINSIEGKYTQNEIDEISKELNQNQNNKKGPLTINLNLKSLKFALKENKDNNLLTTFVVDNLNTEIIKNGFDNDVSFQLDSFNVLNFMNKSYPKIVESKNGIKGSIKINYNEPYQVSLIVSPIFAAIDAEWIAKMFKFFEKRRTFIDNDDDNDKSQMIHKMQEIIDSHTRLKLDLEIDKSKIIVPYKEISFDLSFNSFLLNSSPSPKYDINEIESLFDNYKISVADIQIHLADQKMTEKFNVNSSFDVALIKSQKFDSIKADCELSPLKIYLTTFQALLINELQSYLTDTIKTNVENIEVDKSTNVITAENKYSIKIPSVSLLILYEQKKLYQVEVEKQTNIEVSDKNKIANISILNEQTGIKCYEFLTSEKGNFFNSQKIDFNLDIQSKNQKVSLDFGNVELFAKAKPLNFLIVFFKSPKNYEWKLNLNHESRIEKYLHKCNNKEDNKTTNVSIKIRNTVAHLIDFDQTKNGNRNETELLQLTTKEVLVSALKTQFTFNVNVDVSPPKVTTNQYGRIWKNIISEEDLMTSPINIKINPASFSMNFINLKANVYPLLLFKIINFIKITKNSHSHLDGDPDTMPYMRFNISAINSQMKIIYNLKSSNYYELNVPSFKFVTIQAPLIHQISFDNIEIIDKNNQSLNKLFDVKNLALTIDMKFLLKENIQRKNDIKSFNTIMNEKGFDKWQEETMNLIQNEKNEMKLDNVNFYFYAVSFKFEFDNLLCTYSHSFARDITFLTSNVLKIIKCDSSFNYNSNDILEFDEPLEITLIFSVNKIDFIVLNETPVSVLSMNKAEIQYELQNDNFLVEINKVNLVDNNQSQIFEANELSLFSSNNVICASLNSFDLVVILEYVPLTVDYIMNCPFFSFADEFKKNKTKPTSFDMLKSINFAINQFSIKLPLKENLFFFKISFDSSLHPDGRIAQVRDIQMLLNDRIIIKPFSVVFNNDKWIIDPIFITFSVFELYIIEQLVNKIKSVSMPKIYLSKKEVEMSRRKFEIYISTVKFILTQPNLPFLWLEIKPSIFRQSFDDQNGGEKIIEYKIESLIKHANYSNCGFDTVIDPFWVSFQSKNSTKSSNTKIDISPITFSVSSSFIKEIFVFRKKFEMFKSSNNDSKIFQDEIIYFQNDTGLQITLTLFKGDSKKMKINEKDEDENEGEVTVLSNDKPYKLINFDPEYDIKVTFLNHSVYFSMKDLCFPIFFENIAVAYIVADIGIQTIHFSSPYIVKNELPYEIEVFVGHDTIGSIKSGFQQPIPLNSTSLLQDGIRAAMSPIRTEISPSVRIMKYHSYTLLYKIIDNTKYRDLYSTIYVSVDPKRSISYITFLPNITFTNHLPVNVKLVFFDEFDDFSFGGDKIEFEMETGKIIDASFIRTNRSSITIKLVIDQFGESDPITINPFETSPVPFQFTIRNKYIETCKVAVMSIYSPEKMVFQIIIFTPCVMYNETGAPLYIKESKKDYQEFPFINKMFFYTPKGFFKKKKVKARVIYPKITFSNNNSFDCMHPNTSQTVPLPYVEDPSTFFVFSAITNEAPVQFNHTTIVTLITSLSITNHFNEIVFFAPSETNTFINTCLPNKKTALVYSNHLSTFDVYVNGYKRCKKVALVNPTTTVFRLLSEDGNKPDFLIQLDLIKEESGFCGHISYPSLPTPTVITNMLENKIIYAYQDEFYSPDQLSKKNKVVIDQMSTSLFAKEQPFIEGNLTFNNRIIITIGDNEITFPVSFSSDTDPVQIQSSNYFYEVRTTKRGNQMIIITENNHSTKPSSNNNNNNNDDDEYEEFQVAENSKVTIIDIVLNKLQISFIDSLLHELCLLTLRNIRFKENKKNSIQLTIDSIQLDDMYVASKSPVVLFSTNPRFLTASLKSELPLSMHSFDDIDVTITEIRLFADYAFISDLSSVITEIHEDSKMAMNYSQAKTTKKRHNTNSNTNDDNDNVNKSDASVDWSNNDILDEQDQIKEEEKFRSSTFYSIKKFKVSPIRLTLNFRGSSGRQLIHPPSNDFRISMLKYVPNVSGGKMELPQVEIVGVRAPLDAFRKHLIGSYRNQFIKEAVKVLFHADLLLNVVGVAKGVVGVFTDKNKSKKEAFTNLGGQLLQSVEGIMRILPSNIHLANSSKQPKSSRFSKFIGNVANALDKGADKINTTKQELIEETVPLPQREPRAFPMGRILSVTPRRNIIQIQSSNINISDDKNDNDNGYGGLNNGFCENPKRLYIAQNTFQKLYKSLPDHADERLLAFVDSENNQNTNSQSYALAIFDHYVAVLSSNLLVVVLESRINEIVSVEFKEKTVILTVYNKYDKLKSFSFNCRTENEARSITIIVSSVAARMNLFSE